MLGLEKGLQNAQKGSALTSMFQPALLLQDSCESSENLKADVLDETGKIDPFCSQCMYVVGFSGLNTFHLMYTLLPLRCINLSKKPVQTIPTLLEAISRNCAHSRNHECVRSILPEFYAAIFSSWQERSLFRVSLQKHLQYMCSIFAQSWTQQKPVEAQVSTSISLTVYLNIIPGSKVHL